jgi:tetratricopeptide (TPR) repeat protein
VPPESPRIIDLRRRVQADPASIAFAQLAEEYRRAGSHDEAIQTCRAGLARHPGYLSARVTLGRALIETGAIDDAAREFELVLRSAPDNLAALRGIAEIHQRRGELQEALEYYKRALDLARHDPDLEETVANIGRELATVKTPAANAGLSFAEAQSELMSFVSRFAGPDAADPADVADTPAPAAATYDAPVASVAPAASVHSPELTDFDALLHQLGAPNAAPPPVMEALLSPSAPAAAATAQAASQAPRMTAMGDPFAALERELRALDAPDARGAEPPAAPPNPPERDSMVLEELEDWLLTLQTERARQESSES